eukprot:COSAG04_NODE_17772_length_459_cov_1.008333_1_plen_132_part_10
MCISQHRREARPHPQPLCHSNSRPKLVVGVGGEGMWRGGVLAAVHLRRVLLLPARREEPAWAMAAAEPCEFVSLVSHEVFAQQAQGQEWSQAQSDQVHLESCVAAHQHRQSDRAPVIVSAHHVGMNSTALTP